MIKLDYLPADTETELSPVHFHFEEKDLQYYLGITANCIPKENLFPEDSKRHRIHSCVFIFTKKYIGKPDPLGYNLLKSLLNRLSRAHSVPKYLIFMHEASELCTKNAETADALEKIQKLGASIKVCRTSAQYLGISENISLGSLISEDSILDICLNSEKAVNF